MFHSSTMRKSRYERPSPQLTSPVSTVTDLSPHFRFEKQIKTVQTWCFCTKKKNDLSWGLLMENLKYWLLIGRANLISTNSLSFTVCSQPLGSFRQSIFDCNPLLKKAFPTGEAVGGAASRKYQVDSAIMSTVILDLQPFNQVNR